MFLGPPKPFDESLEFLSALRVFVVKPESL